MAVLLLFVASVSLLGDLEAGAADLLGDIFWTSWRGGANVITLIGGADAIVREH